MTRQLPPGVYDHLMHRGLADLVAELRSEHDVEEKEIEAADQSRYLARHVERLLARAVGSIAADSEEARPRRVELVNQLLETLAAAVEGRDLFEPGEMSIV